jgi:hypothetical protein
MRRLTYGLSAGILGVVSIFLITGCDDVSGQVLDTIGFAGDIVSVWLD